MRVYAHEQKLGRNGAGGNGVDVKVEGYVYKMKI